MPRRLASLTTIALLSMVTALAADTAAGRPATVRGYGPPPRQNPSTAPNGFGFMHGDSASSDTTPVAGPGTGQISAKATDIGGVCASVVVGPDGRPIAVCTQISSRRPTAYLINPKSGASLASYSVAKGSSLLAGVYVYIDNRDRLVIADGHNQLLRLSHRRTKGKWAFHVASRLSLAAPVRRECGTDNCDTTVGLTPDYAGRVWFATVGGIVGYADPRTHRVRSVHLPNGEQIANSISSVPGYVSVVSDHALYLFTSRHGRIRELWRLRYDRSFARKPGQLSWGSGTTPVFFGPRNGARYLAITDNHRPHERLVVVRMPQSHRRTRFRPHVACRIPVLTTTPQSGTELAPIGSGRSVFVTSSYGYTYPPTAAQGSSSPSSAPFRGGMTRVVVNRAGTACRRLWDRMIRSSALPRLALANGRIDTIIGKPASPSETQEYADRSYYAEIDADTGRVLGEHYLGSGPSYDPLVLVGVTTRKHVFYNGTVTGWLRIAPK